MDESKRKVGLLNRTNYPVTVSYKGESFQLPPKSRTEKEFILSKLGKIDPKDVSIIR